MHRPPQVLIVRVSGHQTRMVVWIDLLWLHVRAAALGVRTVNYLELAMKMIGSGCALSHVACNVVQVAAWFGYTPNEGFGSRGHVQQCRDCR